MNENTVILSVCIITYNHEKYISQAIEGVLMQKTNFIVELVIGEDCSTDNTRSICLAYKEKYPDVIKLLLSEKNLGAMDNFYTTIHNCTGKYIAICEGDDYWIDPYKLQKQVDFLEANEETSMCFHDAIIIDSTDEKAGNCRRYDKDRYAPVEDIIKGGGAFCPTASLVFRAKYIKYDYPDFCKNCFVGDYPLQLYLSFKGKVYYINNAMSVYRTGVINSYSQTYLKVDYLLRMKILMSRLKMLDGIHDLFSNAYSSLFVSQKVYAISIEILHIFLSLKFINIIPLKRTINIYMQTFYFKQKIKLTLFILLSTLKLFMNVIVSKISFFSVPKNYNKLIKRY